MLDSFPVPYLLDGRRPFKISYDDSRGIFQAHAFSESRLEWERVEVSRDFNALFAKCTGEGMSYDGATEDALYRASFGPTP